MLRPTLIDIQQRMPSRTACICSSRCSSHDVEHRRAVLGASWQLGATVVFKEGRYWGPCATLARSSVVAKWPRRLRPPSSTPPAVADVGVRRPEQRIGVSEFGLAGRVGIARPSSIAIVACRNASALRLRYRVATGTKVGTPKKVLTEARVGQRSAGHIS